MRSSEGFVFVRPGLHLYYHVLGEGRETLVVPNANWLSDLLQPLAEGRRLILYDPRSRGRSSAVTDSRHLSLEDDVADLEAVRRYFGLERMSLLGTSYHAAITATYALENPERVGRMLLVSPITPRRPGEWVQETPTWEELTYPPGIRWPSAGPGSTTSCCRPRWGSWLRPPASRWTTSAPSPTSGRSTP
jgi:pimeloyl-ACP methyl ester carboxylesterase